MVLQENAAGSVEDNEILANALPGIAIGAGGDPLVRGNVIRDEAGDGSLVLDGGMGRIEDNRIFGNTGRPINVAEDAGAVELGDNAFERDAEHSPPAAHGDILDSFEGAGQSRENGG